MHHKHAIFGRPIAVAIVIKGPIIIVKYKNELKYNNNCVFKSMDHFVWQIKGNSRDTTLMYPLGLYLDPVTFGLINVLQCLK